MNLLVTSYDTWFSNVIQKYTEDEWSHCALVHDDTVYEFNYNMKEIVSLDDVLSEPKLEKFALLEGEDIYYQFADVFTDAVYDMKAILKLKSKLCIGRDTENVLTTENSYHCAALASYLLGLNTKHHYSQTIPSDFMYHMKILEQSHNN